MYIYIYICIYIYVYIYIYISRRWCVPERSLRCGKAGMRAHVWKSDVWKSEAVTRRQEQGPKTAAKSRRSGASVGTGASSAAHRSPR